MEHLLQHSALLSLCSSSIIIRVIKSRTMTWAGHVARMGGEERHIEAFSGIPVGKKPLRRPRRRWKNNIKIDRQGFG